MQNLSFKNAYLYGFKFNLFVEPVYWAGGCEFTKIDEAFNHLADKTSVSPEAIITDYVCCALGLMWAGHNWSSAQTKAYWNLPCKLSLLNLIYISA